MINSLKEPSIVESEIFAIRINLEDISDHLHRIAEALELAHPDPDVEDEE